MVSQDKLRVLLLNPPGDLPYLRGGYCSGVSKGKYYYPPIDLLIQSGYLSKLFNVTVLDGVIENISEKETLRFFEYKGFDVILAVTAHCSWKQDLSLLGKIHQVFPGTRIFLSGGYLLFQGKQVIEENPFVEGILLDFTSPSLSRFLANGKNQCSGDILTLQSDGTRRVRKKGLEYPCPRHELFPMRKYMLPFGRYRPFSIIHQSFGCPYRCSFCVFSNIDFQLRNTGNVLQELLLLKKLGVKELFMGDPTFAANPAAAKELCRAMIDENFQFSWFCQTRTDVMDGQLLDLMKQSGCHTIQFGVETTQIKLQKNYKKNLDFNKATEIFRACKQKGIRILASIIIGLPGDTRENILHTLDYLTREKFDYLSVNIAAPEIGTEFRDNALDKGLFSLPEENQDVTHLKPLLHIPRLTRSEQWTLRNQVIRKFYFRPAYILNRIVATRTWTEFLNLVNEGYLLFRSSLLF